MLTPTRDATKRGELIAQINQDYKRGLLSDNELVELQRAVMPVCEYCKIKPSVCVVERRYCCQECFHSFKDTPHGQI